MEKAIGPIIKRLREERNITRTELARACGFSRNYLIDIEDCTSPTASETNLRKIAEYLNADAVYLFDVMTAIKGSIAISVKDQPEEVRRFLYRLSGRMAHGTPPSPETAAKLTAILDEDPVAA